MYKDVSSSNNGSFFLNNMFWQIMACLVGRYGVCCTNLVFYKTVYSNGTVYYIKYTHVPVLIYSAWIWFSYIWFQSMQQTYSPKHLMLIHDSYAPNASVYVISINETLGSIEWQLHTDTHGTHTVSISVQITKKQHWSHWCTGVLYL